MFRNKRYLKNNAEEEFNHLLNEATLLVEALVLQHTGSNIDKLKNFEIKKASIDSLNDILYTLKIFIKEKLHFLGEYLGEIEKENFSHIEKNKEFAKLIEYIVKLNLVSDNNDIALYLAPYIHYWDLLTAGVQTIILNHVIRSINQEIQRVKFAEQIAKKF